MSSRAVIGDVQHALLRVAGDGAGVLLFVVLGDGVHAERRHHLGAAGWTGQQITRPELVWPVEGVPGLVDRARGDAFLERHANLPHPHEGLALDTDRLSHPVSPPQTIGRTAGARRRPASARASGHAPPTAADPRRRSAPGSSATCPSRGSAATGCGRTAAVARRTPDRPAPDSPWTLRTGGPSLGTGRRRWPSFDARAAARPSP